MTERKYFRVSLNTISKINADTEEEAQKIFWEDMEKISKVYSGKEKVVDLVQEHDCPEVLKIEVEMYGGKKKLKLKASEGSKWISEDDWMEWKKQNFEVVSYSGYLAYRTSMSPADRALLPSDPEKAFGRFAGWRY